MLNIRNYIVKCALYYYWPYLFIYTIIPKASNMLNFFLFTSLLFLYNVYAIRKNENKIIIIDVLIAVLSLIRISENGIDYIRNNDFFGLPFLMLIFCIFSDSMVIDSFEYYIQRNYKRVLASIVVFIAIMGITAITKTGFDRHGFFQGPYMLPHLLAYQAIIMFATIIIIQNSCEKKLYMYIIQLALSIMIFATCVRTAVLILAILVLYEFLCFRSWSLKVSIIAVCLTLSFILVYNSNLIYNIPVIKKTIEAESNGSITNGRDWYLEWSMIKYSSLTRFEQFIGIGIEPLREVMYNHVGIAIHAHNDFANILVGYGQLGIISITIALIRFLSNSKLLWIIPIFGIFIWFNGLIMYTPVIVGCGIFKVCFRKSSSNQKKGIIYDNQ